MAQYAFSLAQPTAKVYRELSEKVSLCLGKGQFDAPCVRALDELERIFEAIAANPIDEDRRLCGVLNHLFRVGGKSVRVCYTLNTAQTEIIIVSVMHETIGVPDPQEVFETCAQILTSQEHGLRRLLGLTSLPSRNTPLQ